MPKILIVDDDAELRNIYAEVFKQNEFDVLEAGDGLEGLDKAIKEIPDVIFTGIIMPNMDGFSLKEALAKNVATSSIPVVMNSHMGREEDRVKSLEMGVKDFIVYGMVTPKEVVRKISAILGQSFKKYKLKLNPTELDAQELMKDMDTNVNFHCKNCSTELILELEMRDAAKKEVAGRIYCPNCG